MNANISKWKYISLNKKHRDMYYKTWQFKSFDYIWIKGYDTSYKNRIRYYLKTTPPQQVPKLLD